MLTKEKLLDSIEEFSIDELVERLVFVQKVERGIARGERGETFTTEQLKDKLAKWLQ